MKEFKKYVFITGASGGIGSASARLFVKKGCFVGLTDIDEKGLERLCAELGHENVFWQPADVSSGEQLAAAINAFAGHTGGRLDVLLNNAGILRAGNFENHRPEEYRQLIEVNLLGIINAIYPAIPFMERSDNPRIINLSSASALYGIPGLAVYSATKFAIRGLTEALNIELERRGIMVCDIMPGYVKTKMVEDASDELHLEDGESLLRPEEVAVTVWKATQRKRLHWPVGRKIRLLSALIAFLPASLRKTVAIQASHYRK